MKVKLLYIFFAIAFCFSVEACPYQKMAEVDSKLYSETSVNSKKFAKIANLKAKGQEMLEIGELETAEAIFDKALSLFSKN